MFKVVRPVSYRPGAGYFWKYRVPMNELPQLLLSRTDVPNTGRGMVLLGRHRAGDWRSRALGKLASGSQKCVSDLQRVCGGWRSRAALISAAHPLPRELIEPFPSKGLAIARRGPGDVGARLDGLKREAPATPPGSGRCARAERAATPLRHRIARRGRLRRPSPRRRRGEDERAPAEPGQPRQEELPHSPHAAGATPPWTPK